MNQFPHAVLNDRQDPLNSMNMEIYVHVGGKNNNCIHPTTSHHPSHNVPAEHEEEDEDDYSGGSRPPEKQYWQFMQAVQDEAGTCPGEPGLVCGRHRPIAAMYLAARGTLGAVDKSVISSAGNTIRPMPMDVISDDILCSDITKCERIWRFDNIVDCCRHNMFLT